MKGLYQVTSRKASWNLHVFLLAFYFLGGCAWFQSTPEVPLRQATAEQLTGMLEEREGTIRTMKGLFRAQVAGKGIPIAQRMEIAMFYRRPESLRLQGFSQVGSKLFEFSRRQEHYRLELPSEGRRYAGSIEDLKQAKIGRLLQLSQWAVSGVVGNDMAPSGLRTVLAEDGDRYRLDVFQAEGRLLRRLWFERRSLYMVQEDRMLENGEVEASMTFEDFRSIPRAPADAGAATVMPFRVTVTDHVVSGSVALTFHEIVLNPALKPEELARQGARGADETAGG